MNSLRIVTPLRLHFGLLGWGPHAHRQFGGFGLMVDVAGYDLSARSADHDAISGCTTQAKAFAELREVIRANLKKRGLVLPPCEIVVDSEIRPHFGLGSGTQRALAMAELAAILAGWHDPTVPDLAALAGRFPRSGVGTYGYRSGGLIVDAGHDQGLSGHCATAQLVDRCDWPEDWHIVIVMPPEQPGPTGSREIEAFRELPPPSEASISHVARLLESCFLPSVRSRNFDDAMSSLEEIQAIVGGWFAPAQCGHVYGSELRDRLIETFRTLGFRGLGQSSWGPALFGFMQAGEGRTGVISQDLAGPEGFGNHSPVPEWLLATANNRGRKIYRSDSRVD